MARFYLIFLLVAGLLSSMLSQCGASPSSSAGKDVFERKSPRFEADLARGERYTRDEADSGGFGEIELRREYDGHFYADTAINGQTIRMLVDTGASGIALTRDDARRAGLGTSIGMPNVVGQGASGDVHGEYVTLDRVSLGSESAESVPAIVLDSGGQSLLGQSFLSRFEVEIKGDRMVLR